MAEHSRYYVSDNDASVSKGILKNKLGIKSRKKLSEAETLLLADTYTHFFELLRKGKLKFDLSLLFSIHEYFLSHLYDWAGKVRMVNISKDNMLFAPVKYIDEALAEFKKLLKTKLPKQSDTKDKVSEKLAIIHNEFNVIHPFREGNGRTIRLFLDLIVVHFRYNPIDWSKTPNNDYLKACILGVNGDNKPMAKIIKKGLNQSK
ncbi:MAG: Fic family protein [Candidatus Komeilibacteria bacterium]|nr:Fic family protein [Candidatus Komeilibacteria bacterium]